MGVFFQTQADPSDPFQPQADLADAKLVHSLTCWLVGSLTRWLVDFDVKNVYLNLK